MKINKYFFFLTWIMLWNSLHDLVFRGVAVIPLVISVFKTAKRLLLLEDETLWRDLMWGVQVYCFELPICSPDSRTPEGRFVLPRYLLLLFSPDSFQVCMCLYTCMWETEGKRGQVASMCMLHVHADAEVGECLYWHSCVGPYTAAYVSVDRHPLARAK